MIEPCQEEIYSTFVSGDKQIIIEQQNTGTAPLNYLMIYTPFTRKSVAIEPMSCNINAFNNGDRLTILSSNEEMNGGVRIKLLKSNERQGSKG